VLGPRFVAAVRPPPDAFTDFSQEWLSARNYRAGLPVYANQTESLYRHTDLLRAPGEGILPWNAHPPASILLALPFARLDYADAHLAWNLATAPLFVLAVVLVLRELRVRLRPSSVFPATVLVIACHPLSYQLLQGQLDFVLAFLVTAAWVADRRGRPGWAGAAVGAATAIKLYPGFLFVYFLFARRWRALATGAAAFLALNALAAGVFGPEAFRTYVGEVLPAVVGYRTDWRNVSLAGFWLRLFDPDEADRVAAVVRAPFAGHVIAAACRLAVAAVVAVVCVRVKSVAARDRAFALCLVGMLLVSPIAWTHYFLLLLLPLGLVWARLPADGPRVAMWAAFLVMWLPENFFATLVFGPEVATAMARNKHPLLGAWDCFVATAPLHLALVGLFALTLLTPAAEPEADAGSPGESDEERLDRRLFGPVGGGTSAAQPVAGR